MKSFLLFPLLPSLACILAVGFRVLASDEDVPFSSLEIAETSCMSVLLENPFLMEQGGASFLRLPGGTNMLLAVGQTDIRFNAPNPQQEKIRQRTVADRKARKAVAEAIHGIHVCSFVQTTERTVVRRSGETEEAVENLTELLERSESDTLGLIPGLSVIATWTLPSEQLFCLAIGRLFPPSE